MIIRNGINGMTDGKKALTVGVAMLSLTFSSFSNRCRAENAPESLVSTNVFVTEESGGDSFVMSAAEIAAYQRIGANTGTFFLQENDGDVFYEALLFLTATSGIYVETRLVDDQGGQAVEIDWQNQNPVAGVFRLNQAPDAPGAGNQYAPLELPGVSITMEDESGNDAFIISSSDVKSYQKLGSDIGCFILEEDDGDVFQELLFFESPTSGTYIETRKVDKGIAVSVQDQSSVVGTFKINYLTLKPGWNLIVLNPSEPGQTYGERLAECAVGHAWGWNATRQRMEKFDNVAVDSKQAVWIYVNELCGIED